MIDKKNSISREIVSLISQNKKLRQERNQLTSEVKQSKVKRDTINTQVAGKVEELKKGKEERKAVAVKEHIDASPQEMKKQLDRLNFKLETEVVSFEKEKQLMKVINVLKKKYEQAKKVYSQFGKQKEISKEVDSLRPQANVLHKEIQEKAKHSQERHEKIIENNKKIDELKKQEDELMKQINLKIAEVDESGKKLDEKARPYTDISKQLNVERKEFREEKVKAKKKKLSDLQDEVQQKISKGGKLTTEDLLIMQTIKD